MTALTATASTLTTRGKSEFDFSDFDEFAARVGLITFSEKLTDIQAPPQFCEETGGFETEDLTALQNFCEKNPQYHIVTLTSDSDDVESELAEDLWKANGSGGEWDDQPDAVQSAFREKWGIYAITMDNKVRIVNRLNYYLANGDKNPQITLTEIG